MSEAHTHTNHGAGEVPAPQAPEHLASSYTDGGHEVDLPPSRNLMVFLSLMAVLMVLAAIGVYQLFVAHTGEQLSAAASIPASQLVEQHAREDEIATTYGKVEGNSETGQPSAYRVPYAAAKRMVLTDPAKFAAAPPPAGWVHPDDAQ